RANGPDCGSTGAAPPPADYRRRPVLYTTIIQADAVEKIIRLSPHHHFGPMMIGMSIDRSLALSPTDVSHPPRPGQRPRGVGNRIPVCPSPQFGGNDTSGGLDTLPTGSHQSPFWQPSGAGLLEDVISSNAISVRCLSAPIWKSRT